MPDVNGLFPTKTRTALLRAIYDGGGRIYYEPAAKEARDKLTYRRVTDLIRQFIAADWIRALAPGEPRGPGESDLLVYYRLKPFGAVALGVATNSIEKEQSNGADR